MSGTLLIIGTPIGNLDDLSPRATRALASCDLLLCEDTRHTGKLLSHLGIGTRLESFHDHNEDQKAERIVGLIAEGKTVGLVSDAGMPVISDPGFALVRLARVRGLPVEVIPGPFAGVTALAASGIAPLPFMFHGFPPHRHGERLDFYQRIAALGMTAVLYESPQRIIGSLEDARAAMGDVEAAVAREMTKLHEELLRGSLSSLIEELTARETIRGEITVVLAAASAEPHPKISDEEIRREFEKLRAKGIRRNDAIKLLAEGHGVRKNELYRILLGE